VLPNPDVAWLAPMYERLWRDHPDVDCIVALGGGSVIDCAKVMLTRPPRAASTSCWNCSKARAPPASAGRHRRLLAIPTTAGTGSEVTPWATVWDQARSRKLSLQLPWTWPEAAIVDADLMLSLPHAATLASGLDALSHALESLWNVHRNPVSASLAVSAARSIVATLPPCWRSPSAPSCASASPPRRCRPAWRSPTRARRSRTRCPTTSRSARHAARHRLLVQPAADHAAGGRARRRRSTRCCSRCSTPATSTRPSTPLSAFLQDLGVSVDPASYGIPEADWSDRIQQALAGARGRNFIAAPEARRLLVTFSRTP
jgi:hypothetical protein